MRRTSPGSGPWRSIAPVATLEGDRRRPHLESRSVPVLQHSPFEVAVMIDLWWSRGRFCALPVHPFEAAEAAELTVSITTAVRWCGRGRRVVWLPAYNSSQAVCMF